MDEFDLNGRTALVSGAGQGVGRATALLLAAHGARVVVNDLVAERAEHVVTEIRDRGGAADSAVGDVTDPDQVGSLVAAAGPVDVLVNNAGLPPGMFQLKPFLELEPGDWEPVIRLNLYGVLYLTRAVLGGMVERGWGRVITVISDAARAGDARQSVYAAAKAAAAGFSRVLASEVGRHGVTVNCVSLASIRPGFDPSQPLPEEEARRFRSYAIRRPGRPEDVAPMILFLASDASSWITGQVYPVNGGYTFAL
ncbi:MAG TPA: SDR family oxidoreductase [Acidimicrobiales bacterium]|nr:SDR family oxidoreductase [Acidimicrobiales bacterium]